MDGGRGSRLVGRQLLLLLLLSRAPLPSCRWLLPTIVPPPPSPFLVLLVPLQVADAVYHANAHVLLQGDACFRFEELPARGGLTLQLMDADKMDAPPGESGPGRERKR